MHATAMSTAGAKIARRHKIQIRQVVMKEWKLHLKLQNLKQMAASHNRSCVLGKGWCGWHHQAKQNQWFKLAVQKLSAQRICSLAAKVSQYS